MIGFALAGQASGQPEPLRPVFDQTVCDLAGVSPEIRPRLRCGTVGVPRNYDHPGAHRFKLAVVVVRSAQQPALPEPVVYISGGPGGPLTVYADHQARTPYAPSRDLVLVDQRGTGRSEPNLCPDLDGALLDAALAVATDPSDDALAKRRSVYAACRAEATARGFDMRDFGTSVTVADFEWVRRALGIERWNVYGESYGTTVAMTLVALHPETVRAAVLDSLYLPDPRPMQSTNVADALDAFGARRGVSMRRPFAPLRPALGSRRLCGVLGQGLEERQASDLHRGEQGRASLQVPFRFAAADCRGRVTFTLPAGATRGLRCSSVMPGSLPQTSL
jgi:pimeloyl-ACP methyl ester carboxylesterase